MLIGENIQFLAFSLLTKYSISLFVLNLFLGEIDMNRIRVNWRQAIRARDKMARLHKCLENQPKRCRFDEMKDWQEFENVEDAQMEANWKNIVLKQCEQCFKA